MNKLIKVLMHLFAKILVFGIPVFGVVDKWTPAGFNWSNHEMGAPETWNGLYYSLSNPSVVVSKDILAIGNVRMADDNSVTLAIPFFLGVAFQVFNLALTGIGLAGTIDGCAQSQGKPDNILFCVGGLVSTIVGIGGIASAAKNLAKSKGFLAVAANSWDNSGLEQIALDVFNRRGIDANITAQKAHNYFVNRALCSLAADGEVDFVGYAPNEHPLARRKSSEHPLAPMLKFMHKRYGRTEVTSRDTGDMGAMYFTVSYKGHPTHQVAKEKRDEYYQHERLSSGLMEARFDSEASLADPASISFDGRGTFDHIESEVQCSIGNSWPDGQVMSVQMYDQANQATFGFASIGIFADNSVDSGLEGFEPAGMPLPSQSC